MIGGALSAASRKTSWTVSSRNGSQPAYKKDTPLSETPRKPRQNLSLFLSLSAEHCSLKKALEQPDFECQTFGGISVSKRLGHHHFQRF